MLERLLEQRDAVTVLTGVPNIKNLSAQQWTTAQDITAALRPFMLVTQLMSGATYPTVSMIIPVLDGLKDLLRSATGGLDVLRGILVRLVDEKFGDVFEDLELCTATVVDPRFKATPFDTEDKRDKALTATLRAMAAAAAAIVTPTPTTTPPPQPSTSAAPNAGDIWAKLDRAVGLRRHQVLQRLRHRMLHCGSR